MPRGFFSAHKGRITRRKLDTQAAYSREPPNLTSPRFMNSFAYRRINIVGASGSGTTTLGRALATRLGLKFSDADRFDWKPTLLPFTAKYDPDARLTMLLAELEAFPASIVAGSVCGWGAELENGFDLVIFLSLPTKLRLQRIEARDVSLFGAVDPGHLARAAQYEEGKLPGHNRMRHEAWLLNRPCRVLRFEEDQAVDARVEHIIELISRPA
jgi:hypothetical protein